jgi:hypothetical protein
MFELKRDPYINTSAQVRDGVEEALDWYLRTTGLRVVVDKWSHALVRSPNYRTNVVLDR